jgi:hydroxyacylglutathione hydrolase
MLSCDHHNMLTISPVPAFADNYIWVLQREDQAVVVDPGDAQPVLTYLQQHGLHLAAILITHHHGDHVGGLPRLARNGVPVYGPRAEADSIRRLTHTLDDGDRIDVLGLSLSALAIPGHTAGHIAFYGEGLLFCGDTLFSAGCGRLFEGTPAQMHASLQRLAALPGSTQVYCGHEYTLANLTFAQAVEPHNSAVTRAMATARDQRARGLPTLPSTLTHERAVNPSLRVDQPDVIAAATRAGADSGEAVAVFATLRHWKDNYRPPAA